MPFTSFLDRSEKVPVQNDSIPTKSSSSWLSNGHFMLKNVFSLMYIYPCIEWFPYLSNFVLEIVKKISCNMDSPTWLECIKLPSTWIFTLISFSCGIGAQLVIEWISNNRRIPVVNIGTLSCVVYAVYALLYLLLTRSIINAHA